MHGSGASIRRSAATRRLEPGGGSAPTETPDSPEAFLKEAAEPLLAEPGKAGRRHQRGGFRVEVPRVQGDS